MCICINCLYIENCSIYNIIREQHSKNIFSKKDLFSVFSPHAPIVNVNITSQYLLLKVDWDVIECLSFIDKPGNWR